MLKFTAIFILRFSTIFTVKKIQASTFNIFHSQFYKMALLGTTLMKIFKKFEV